MKILAAYYSWSNGNTKRIAEMIAQITGADLLRIETEIPYEGTYDEVVEQGKKETDSGYQPEIVSTDLDLDSYDLIFAGTPTWWYTMAPAMHTFLASEDWHHKNAALFMTNAGWPGHVIKDMEKICQDADIMGTKEIRFDSDGGDHMITLEQEVREWIQTCIQKLKEKEENKK